MPPIPGSSCACAPSHPLADRGQVGLAELAGEPFVDFQPDWGLRMLLDQSFAAAGLHRASTPEVNDVPSLLQLVARGLGIALVPEVVSRHPAPVRYLRLRPPAPSFDVALATMGDPRPARPPASCSPCSTRPTPPDARVAGRRRVAR